MVADKDAKPPDGGGKKKSGMKPVLFLIIGAVAGGAGVVFLAPRPAVVKVVGPQQPEIEQVELPDLWEFTFNPRVERGFKVAQVSFFVVYKQDKRKEAEVTKSLKTNWNRAYSRCMEVLTNTPPANLGSFDGKQKLRACLRDELSASLFPDGIATVDDILWKKFSVN